jgi:NAD(P)-dependent dehydrogenase (short-subunit alcohol dehydrogenase family)
VTVRTQRQNARALITGASRGLGYALARKLADHGWTLIIDSRSVRDLQFAADSIGPANQVRAVAGDINDVKHRRDLLEAAVSIGGLDAVVCNAGTLGPSPRPELMEFPLHELQHLMQTNFVSQVGLLQTVAPTFSSHPRIVIITSDAATQPYPAWGGYGASKAALELATRVLAEERPDWRIMIVDPGNMRTQMQQDAYPGEDISDRPLPEDSVPGLLELLEGDHKSGCYLASELCAMGNQSDVPII